MKVVEISKKNKQTICKKRNIYLKLSYATCFSLNVNPHQA